MTEAAQKKEKVVETVTMTDGTEVQFSGKQRVLKTTTIHEDGSTNVRFDFRNGQVRTYSLNDTGLNLMRLAAHGFESKVGDSYAGLEDIEDCIEAVEDTTARLYRGEWNAGRTSSGESYAGASILARAIANVKGKPIEAVKDYLRKRTPAEKFALRRSEQFAAEIQRLEAERNAKSKKDAVDVTMALADLDAI